MSPHLIQVILVTVFLFTSVANGYSGSHAYNKTSLEKVSVNAATGTFDFSYPIISTQGTRKPFELNLTYRFNRKGLFGLPKGWQLDLDYIDDKTANIHGQQWLIDPLWRDETLTASGLKYYNQHGSRFIDKIEAKPIPGFKDKTFRFVLQHKDGSLSYFSHQGLLVLKVDRFNNAIIFNYQQPVRSLQSARLTSIIDNYGNQYRFVYSPNEMRVVMPDKRELTIYNDNYGIIKLVDPLMLYTDFSYTNQFDHNLLKSIESPSGLFVNVSYNSINIKNGGKTQAMPVVELFEKIDRATNKIIEQTHYKYSPDNNFTGFPKYSLSDKTDNLMDSNDQSYRYWVQITKSDLGDTPKFHSQLFYYNYLHLPVEVYTLKEGNPYLKTAYTYNISPFKYSRSTNYDKPHTIIKSLWSDAHHRFVDTERNTNNYDRYGNKTFESHEAFDRINNKWNKILSQSYTYFTDYSLKQSTIKTDFVTGQKIQHHYTLSPDKKTHQSLEIFFAQGEKTERWQPWMKQNFRFDSKGRKTYHARQWLITSYPGPEKTWVDYSYEFDSDSKQLTKARIKPSGAAMKSVLDTRNNQRIKRITPLNETWTYRYDALNQLIKRTDPLGHAAEHTYLTYQQDGLNAVIKTSPLGFKQRIIFDAKHQSIEKQDYYNDKWRHLSSSRYNGFSKVITTKDINELTSTTDYDVFERPLVHIDVYGNKTEYKYDDYLLTTTSYLNTHKTHEKVSEPWNLLERQRLYPNVDNPGDSQSDYIENTIKRSGFKKKIEESNSLVHRDLLNQKETVTRFFRYDASLNVIEEKTCGFNDTELTLKYTHDIFKHPVTKQKLLKDKNITSSIMGETVVYDLDGQLSQIHSAKLDSGEQRVTRFSYNKNGKKIKTVLPSGHVISQTYNALNLPENASWSRGGKPYQVSNQYDADRRLISTKDSESQSFSFSYLDNGLLTKMTYPDGQSIDITYDAKNRKRQEKVLSAPVQHFHYDSKDLGKLSSITSEGFQVNYHYGLDDNGYQHQLIQRSFEQPVTGETVETITYGSLGLPVKTEVLNRKEGVVYEVDYEFNARKQLVTLSTHSHKGHSLAESIKMHYSYNALNQLSSETVANAVGTRELSYQYDANGNLTLEQALIDGKHSNKHFVYNPLDQLVQISLDHAPHGKTLSYDIDGRLIKDDQGREYSYDDKGYLLSVKSDSENIQYMYWLDGQLSNRKTQRSSSQKSDIQVFQDDKKNIIAIKDSGHWEYLLRDNKGILASRKGAGDATGHDRVNDEWFMINHSVGALFSDAGKLSTQQYMAYGSPMKVELPNAAGLLGWHQDYTDTELDVVYLKSRFYSPTLKRFITPDTLLVDNRYRYAKSNPLFYYDPTGHNARGLNYGLGSGITALGILGAILAVPTGGASLTLSGGAAVTAGVSTALSGAALMGSQAAIDSGNKQVAKALQYTSIGFGVVALASAGISIAPAIQDYWQIGWFNVTAHWYDNNVQWEELANAIPHAHAVEGGGLYISFSNSEDAVSVASQGESVASSSVSSAELGPPSPVSLPAPFAGGVNSNVFPEAMPAISSVASSESSLDLFATAASNASYQSSEASLSPRTGIGAKLWDLLMGKPTAPVPRPAAVLNWSEIRNFKDITAPIETLDDDVFAEDNPVPSYLHGLLI